MKYLVGRSKVKVRFIASAMPIKHIGRERSRDEQTIQNSEVRLRSKT